jgi:tRNA(Arg) A34 adenosine deaminase TadA
MRFAIRLAAINVQHNNGHPFGAAVFELESGALVAIGINLVMQINCSLAHAEMVALATAQWRIGHFDLRAAGRPPHQLVTSCEPCAMSFGAIPFSGVEGLVCGARSGDAEAIGFDQAMKPTQWPTALQQRGIAVLQDVVREEAVDVLRAYRQRIAAP